jgi:hypothetical protein
MVVSNGVASVLRCPSLVRYAPNSDQNVAVPRLSAMCQKQTSRSTRILIGSIFISE